MEINRLVIQLWKNEKRGLPPYDLKFEFNGIKFGKPDQSWWVQPTSLDKWREWLDKRPESEIESFNSWYDIQENWLNETFEKPKRLGLFRIGHLQKKSEKNGTTRILGHYAVLITGSDPFVYYANSDGFNKTLILKPDKTDPTKLWNYWKSNKRSSECKNQEKSL